MLINKEIKIAMCNGTNGFTMQGTVLQETNRFLILNDRKSGLVHINKDYIVYLEILKNDDNLETVVK